MPLTFGYGIERVDIDAHYRVDRVDQRNCVGSALLRGLARRQDVRDVRRELDDDRDLSDLLDPLGDHTGIFRHLAHRCAHAAFAHTVRAAEIEFETVAACVLRSLDDLVPGLSFGFDHQAGDHRIIGISLLAVGHLPEIDLKRPVGDQLDIVEPDHPQRPLIESRKPRRNVDDRLAERLPHRPAPTGVKCTLDHRTHIRRRRRGEPERIWGFDPCEIDI